MLAYGEEWSAGHRRLAFGTAGEGKDLRGCVLAKHDDVEARRTKGAVDRQQANSYPQEQKVYPTHHNPSYLILEGQL